MLLFPCCSVYSSHSLQQDISEQGAPKSPFLLSLPFFSPSHSCSGTATLTSVFLSYFFQLPFFHMKPTSFHPAFLILRAVETLFSVYRQMFYFVLQIDPCTEGLLRQNLFLPLDFLPSMACCLLFLFVYTSAASSPSISYLSPLELILWDKSSWRCCFKYFI